MTRHQGERVADLRPRRCAAMLGSLSGKRPPIVRAGIAASRYTHSRGSGAPYWRPASKTKACGETIL
jgi:hypothetical protein